MPLAGRGGCPATPVGVPVASRSARAAPPGHAEPDADAAYAADAVPIPLLRGVEPELEVLPEAVFGQGCAAFAVDDRILAEPGWDGDLVRVTGQCGATLVVLSDDARTMERSVGGLPLPLDGGRVVLAPSGAAGMRAALATALRSGEPGSGIAVAVPAHLLLAEPSAAAGWWPAVRSGTVRMVSIGAEEGAADRQLLARLWRAAVAAGHIALEELAALLCWQPARLLGLPAKGRLHPGCDADLAVLDPEAPATDRGEDAAQHSDDTGSGMERHEAFEPSGALRVPHGQEDAGVSGHGHGRAPWCRCCAAGRMPRPRRAAGSALPRCASRCDSRAPDAALARYAALIEVSNRRAVWRQRRAALWAPSGTGPDRLRILLAAS